MPSQHAVLSPSASERWIQCPASIRLSEKVPEQGDSVYAAEGTNAHALAEIELSRELGKINQKTYRARLSEWREETGYSKEEYDDMRVHVQVYVDLVLERADRYPNSAVLLEQRVPTGVPTCWGTSDTVIVSPTHVEIVDLKYGMGVPVSAVGNPQLRLYGVGALEEFGDMLGEAKVVFTTICQPRLHSVSTEELEADALRAWRDSLIPIAEEALGEGARFGPSESACRWCPAAGVCRARVEKFAAEDFAGPDIITNDEMGDLLGRLPDMQNWINAVNSAALERAYSGGQSIPGWKVVMSSGQRKVADQPLAIQVFQEAGFPPEETTTTRLKGIGELEKLIRSRLPGPAKDLSLETVLGELVGRTPGKPSLVPQDDPRPAADPNTEAQKEFS